MRNNQPPAEGEALQRLIEKWRAERRTGTGEIEWVSGYLRGRRKSADELEAALAPLAGPVDASGEPDLWKLAHDYWERDTDADAKAFAETPVIWLMEFAKLVRAAASLPSPPAQPVTFSTTTVHGNATAAPGTPFNGISTIASGVGSVFDANQPPSSPVAPTWFCKGCPETFTSSNVAAEHSRATYHVITSNPLERVFVTESEVGPDSAVRRIAAMAMTAQSDPHASALVYRQALVDICNFALASASSPSAGAAQETKK